MASLKMLNPPEGLDSVEIFEFYYSVNRYLLNFGGIVRWLGIFPERAWVDKLFLVLLLISAAVLTIPQGYGMITQSIGVAGILQIICTNMVLMNVGCKSVVMMYKRKAVKQHEETWKNLWKETVLAEELSLLSRWAKMGKALTYIWLLALILAVGAYVMAPVFIGFQNNFDNRIDLPFPMTMEIESNFILICVYISQIFAAVTVYITVVGLDLVLPVVLLHACGHLKVLQLKLRNIKTDFEKPVKYDNTSTTYSSVESILKTCIRRHQAILNACVELENTFNLLSLIEALCTVWHICLAGVGIILVPEETAKFCLVLASALYHLFVYCWPADCLTSESLEVANAAFCIPWYHCSQSVQIDTLIMIKRAQKSCQYTAGGYFILSLEAFTGLVSNGFSTFAVLRTVM